MDKVIYLKPRGNPDYMTKWSNPNPFAIRLTKETDTAWFRLPVSNPKCPELQYPKFAWELGENKK